MEKGTEILLSEETQEVVNEYFDELSEKIDALNKLEKKIAKKKMSCDATHNKIWAFLGKHPEVNTERNKYCYNHKRNTLTYEGLLTDEDEDVGEKISRALKEALGGDVEVITRKRHVEKHKGNKTKH